jgi:hypothetical protein
MRTTTMSSMSVNPSSSRILQILFSIRCHLLSRCQEFLRSPLYRLTEAPN